ncbi:MAG: peptidoglycan-binding domain-containing protein [Eubacteriales bacterium]
MKKTVLFFICFLILAITPLSASADSEILTIQSEGIEVFMLQKRLCDLGYLNYRATGSYGLMTRKAVSDFQVKNNLSADGSAGEETLNVLFSNDALRAPITETVTLYSGPASTGTASKYGEAVDWATFKDIFTVGTTATITDFNSNTTFTVKRTGGENNAWIEPVSASDNTNYVKSFGGGASYEKRAVLVTLNGTTYAAALFGWPHGKDNVSDNGMSGHTNLFFTGSTSDVLNLPDEEYQEQIDRATQK